MHENMKLNECKQTFKLSLATVLLAKYRQSGKDSDSRTKIPGAFPGSFRYFFWAYRWMLAMILLEMAQKKSKRSVNNCPTF